MDDGILDIKLLPAWGSPRIDGELKAALSLAQVFRGAIAFCTVTDTLLGASLPHVLGHKHGFLCVDLHPPTEVDALASLVRNGSHLYLYRWQVATVTDFGHRESPYLLHAKLLLFWYPDRTADLWVGSHNWTNRALLGLNVESSLVVRVRDSSRLFLQAAAYLEQIKDCSEAFDPAKVDFYKNTQSKMSMGHTPVIALEGNNAAGLENVTILLLGTDVEDLHQLGAIRREVHVLVVDTDSSDQYLYTATILQSGLAPASDPAAGGISFSPRRHAVRLRRTRPVLQPDGPVEATVLATAAYFVTLGLATIDSSVVAEEVPRRAAWEEVSDQVSPLLRRLDPDAMDILFHGRAPHLKRPRSEPPAEALTRSDRGDSREDEPLVIRRILKKKKR